MTTENGQVEEHRLLSLIQQAWPAERWIRTRILLAVSGGADSMSLLHAFHRLQPDSSLLAVAHFNHGWRGDESDQDASFVRQVTEKLEIRFELGEAEQSRQLAKSEESARDLRYEFLSQTAYAIGARYVVTAHTADDRVETLLHNLLRGTGMAGVSPLKTTRTLAEELVLARPLVRATRDDVLDYLQVLGQSYRQDSSNRDSAFRRNFLRNEVLPLIRSKYGASVDQLVLQFADTAEECNEMLDELAEEYWLRVDSLRHSPTESQVGQHQQIVIPSRQTLPCKWPILQRALWLRWKELNWPLGQMNRESWNRIRFLHEAPTGMACGSGSEHATTEQLPGNLYLMHQRDWIVIRD